MRRRLWLACLLTAALGPQGRAQAEPVLNLVSAFRGELQCESATP
jgi:hypothetical protein